MRLTLGLGTLFVVVAGAAAWLLLGRPETYRAGERMKGLTSELDRDLPKDYPRITFTDVTRSAGIVFKHFSGTRTTSLPEDMGSGAAWGDFDGDGWDDLLLVNEVGPLGLDSAARRASPARTTLYRNDRDGTFTDITTAAGIDFAGWGMAAAWVDYDGDGHLDLLLTAYGRNVLYRNDGDGTFTDRSVASGIGLAEGFWTGAAWADYDRDGWLDLYVTGYVQYTPQLRADTPGLNDIENPAGINPSSFKPARNLLYRNRGNGTFEEVAVRAGVAETRGRGLVASWIDIDHDGWLDLFVGNDVSDNVLYRNLGDGRFADISLVARLADYRSTMGIAVGDWNGDGEADLYLTHWLAQGNALYDRVPGTMTFMDESDRYGLGQISLDFVGWGTAFADYDNDGWLDLFVVNGSTLQQLKDPARLVPMRSQLFWNRGPKEGFFEVSSVSGPFFEGTYVGRGLALSDFDRDGDVDAVVTTNGGEVYLLRNDGGNRNRWLQVELRGARGNRSGIGATVRLVAGGRTQVRHVGAQASYLSQSSLVEGFGLGTHERVDTLEVIWPDDRRDLRTGVEAGTRVVVGEGAAAPLVGSDRERITKFWASLRRATTLRSEGKVSEALAAYDEALTLDPDHADARYYAGSLRYDRGEWAAAAAHWRHLLAVDPTSARIHSRLGGLFLCFEKGAPFNIDSAEAHFRRATEINKEETGTLVRLGEASLLRGNDAAALKYFETVLATHATSGPARFYLGYVAWRRGDKVSAEREYLRSITAAPAAVAEKAGVASEGDTKSGQPIVDAPGRCDALRGVVEERTGAAAPGAMAKRYGRLDSLLTSRVLNSRR